MNLLGQYLRATAERGGVFRDYERGISLGCPLSQIIRTAALSGERKLLSVEIENLNEAAEIDRDKKEEITRLAKKEIQNRLRQN